MLGAASYRDAPSTRMGCRRVSAARRCPCAAEPSSQRLTDARSCGSQTAQDVLQQERTDAKWWQDGGGRATLNGVRERDVERFWEKASAEHVDVVGDLKKVPRNSLMPCTEE